MDAPHDHHFLSKNHGGNELKTRLVMLLCASSMVVEITCGIYFGSLALMTDGIHMGTHVIAFFITACAYSIERRYKDDERFVFGTGKVGELAAFTSAIILIFVALYILYEGIDRLIHPEPLRWLESMGVAFVGLGVNIGSVLLLGCGGGGGGGGGESTAEGEVGGGHDHGHGHSHGHRVEDYEVAEDESDDDEDACGGHDETFFVATPAGTAILSIFEDGIPPSFRLGFEQFWKGSLPSPSEVRVTTRRADGSSQIFTFAAMKAPVSGFSSLQSTEEIPEPHEFTALLQLSPGGAEYRVEFREGEGHDHHHARHADEDGHDHGHEHDHGYSAACHSGDHDHDHDHQPHNPVEEGHDHDHAHHGSSSGSQVAIEFPHPHPHPHPHPQKGFSPASAAAGGQAEETKKYHLDNNFRSAVSHVVADSFVSLLVVLAVVVAGNVKSCAFLDPLVGIIGAFVIISWAYTLVYDTSCTLLDINPDLDMTRKLRERLEKDRSTTTLDLHVWRLGPGHLGAIVSVMTAVPRDIEYYRKKIRAFKAISHLTIEIKQKKA